MSNKLYESVQAYTAALSTEGSAASIYYSLKTDPEVLDFVDAGNSLLDILGGVADFVENAKKIAPFVSGATSVVSFSSSLYKAQVSWETRKEITPDIF